MCRNRAAAVVAVLVFALAMLPSASFAQRDAEISKAGVSDVALGDRLVGAALEWGQSAIAWLVALIDEEHGGIVPATPPGAPTP